MPLTRYGLELLFLPLRPNTAFMKWLLIPFLCAGTKIIGAKSIEDMVSKLKKPRRVMMLVKAGPAVDAFIEQLLPFLEKGDIIIDGGNSEYTDSIVSRVVKYSLTQYARVYHVGALCILLHLLIFPKLKCHNYTCSSS